MSLQKSINVFNEYLENYDKNITEIKYKYDHTFRVIEYAKIICENESFHEKNKELTLICALLHDISRFEEWMRYSSWNKIDHGDLGFEILKENNFISKFTDDIEEQNIILNVVKYHNKFDIPKHLNDIEKKILKVVRDADKIDIMMTQTNNMNFEKKCNENWKDIEKIYVKEELINNVLNEELLKNEDVKDIASLLIKQLTFLYDINYRTSYKIIYNLDIVKNKLKSLKEYLINEKQYKILEIKFTDYLESNIKL